MWVLALAALVGGALLLGVGGFRWQATAPAPLAAGVAVTAKAPEAKVPSGPLTIYCGRPEPLMAPLFDRFGDDTGTSLVVRYGDSWGLEGEIVAEGTRTPAAVFVAQDAAALGALSRKGLLVELPMEIVQQVEPRFAGTAAKHDWVGLSGRARAIVHDPAATPAGELPHTLEGVADPRYGGRFGIVPSNESFQAQLALYQVLRGEKALAALLADLKKNRPKIYADSGAAVQAVARREIAFALVNHDSLWREGSAVPPGRLATALMTGDGAGGFVNAAGVGVLSNDPRALDLVRFLLSRPAQEAFAERTFEYPLAKGVAPRQGMPAFASLRIPSFDFADVAAVMEEAERATRRAGLM